LAHLAYDVNAYEGANQNTWLDAAPTPHVREVYADLRDHTANWT